MAWNTNFEQATEFETKEKLQESTFHAQPTFHPSTGKVYTLDGVLRSKYLRHLCFQISKNLIDGKESH